MQYCEHLTPEFLWDETALAHENGVKGLAATYVVADDAAETAARWARFSGLLPFPEEGGVSLKTARGKIFVATRDVLSRFLDRQNIVFRSMIADRPAAPADCNTGWPCASADHPPQAPVASRKGDCAAAPQRSGSAASLRSVSRTVKRSRRFAPSKAATSGPSQMICASTAR